jgi:hypothetical protein
LPQAPQLLLSVCQSVQVPVQQKFEPHAVPSATEVPVSVQVGEPEEQMVDPV